MFMLVLLTTVTVATASTLSMLAGVQSELSDLTLHRDQAFYAAEAGIQRAQYEAEYGAWVNPPIVNGKPSYTSFTATVAGCTYTISAVGSGFNTPAVITSIGTYTADTRITSKITVTLQPASFIPALSLGSGISEAGNITIDGNVLVRGNVNLKGSVAINGTIAYAGTQSNLSYAVYDPDVPTPPQVWYDPTGGKIPPANVINVNSLISQDSASRFSDTSPNSLDFTNHGVLYIVVPAGQSLTLKNVNVYGSGTLVVIGDVNIQNGVGDQTDSVNIVATGTIATKGNFRIFGSMYAGGDMTHQGQFQVTGVLSAAGEMYATVSGNGAGGATIVRALPPDFDPRQAQGSGSVLLQNFTGPTL
ncbi:MAG TPA: hypothetical protein VHQ47_04205 [Phycisphaerae bacterium]|nr:hypothetical protein [Phycisphaerae bacterium]